MRLSGTPSSSSSAPAATLIRVCGLVGERRGRVEARLNLLRGDEEVFRAVERGEVGVGVAEQLNRCTEVLHRRMLLYQARTGGATVATVSGWIAEWKSVHEPATRNVATDLAAPAPGPVMQQDFFTCVLCKSTKDPHLMQPRNFHTYCEHAFFNEMLELWNHRNDYVRMPRTVDEATALLVELSQRFPTMLDA
jgi:hypothetical protein